MADNAPGRAEPAGKASGPAKPHLEAADFIEIDAAPVPPGAEAFYLHTSDGARLRVATMPARPESGQSRRGTVVLLNGRCEIIEKYFEVIGELTARGFDVVTMDWRGQGLSSRMLAMSEKGHIKSFGTYLADLKLFMKHFVRPRHDGPYIGMAHSMGAVPLLQWLAEGYDGFAGAILSSPMTRLFPSPVARQAVRGAAFSAVRMGLGQRLIFGLPEHSMKFEGNNLTHDEARHAMFRQLLEAAPNAAVHAPTYGWVKAAMDAMDAVNAPGALNRMPIPVRIIASGDDTTVDWTNAIRLSDEDALIETTVVRDAFHEVLMEQDRYRDQFWTAFDGFCEETLSPQATLRAVNDGPAQS